MSGLLFCLFSFAISEGLVVTPSRMPSAAASRISLMLAVSMKNFMARPFVVTDMGGFYSKHYLQATRRGGGMDCLESPLGYWDMASESQSANTSKEKAR